MTWTHLDGLPAFRMFDVKYASGDGAVVIASTAYNSRAANDGGIWRSTDGGISWNKPATSSPPCNGGRVNSYGISVIFSRSEVYVGTDCGLAISRDQGVTWTHVSNWNSASPRVFAVSARDYSGASVVDLCGDLGQSPLQQRRRRLDDHRRPAAPFVYCPDTAVHAIAQSPNDQNVLFIVKWDYPITCGSEVTSRFALYGSDDGGASWVRRLFECGLSRPPWVVDDISTTPGGIMVYYSDGLSLRRQDCVGVAPSPRCGTVWTDVPVDHADTNGMALDPHYVCPMYAVSDGGVHKTPEAGQPNACGSLFPMIGTGDAGYQALQIYEVQNRCSTRPAERHLLRHAGQRPVVVGGRGLTWPGKNLLRGLLH